MGASPGCGGGAAKVEEAESSAIMHASIPSHTPAHRDNDDESAISDHARCQCNLVGKGPDNNYSKT